MAKITLGKRPKNFKHNITVPLLDGTTGSMEIIFTYRTRTEFGQMIDGLMDDAGVKPAGEDDESQKLSLAQAMERTKETNADYILKVAEGWNLESDFNRENVAQLCDEIPAAAMAIMNSYRAAITEGKLGN